MCKITQYPILFAVCHHLSVVASFAPCVNSHVPSRQGLYCGPAEWDFSTAAEVETYQARCKYCQSRNAEPGIQWSRNPVAAPRTPREIPQLTESECTPSTPESEMPLLSERVFETRARLEKSAGSKSESGRSFEKLMILRPKITSEEMEEIERDLKTPIETPIKTLIKTPVETPIEMRPTTPSEEPLDYAPVDARPLKEQRAVSDDEALEKAAALYGMSVEDYKEIVEEQKALGGKRKKTSVWDTNDEEF